MNHCGAVNLPPRCNVETRRRHDESACSMKLRLLLLGLVGVLLIAACSPPPPLRDITLLPDESLITGDPCAAPCWNGITPGTTRWADALIILEDDVSLEIGQRQSEDIAAAVEWSPREGSACCQMITQDGVDVSLLFLRVRPTMSVADVIDEHGEPDYVIASPYADEEAIVNLIFPDIQTVVYAFVAGPNASLNPDSEIIGVLYITPEDMELLLVTNNLHAWEGYEPFATYASEDFDVTPSVTLTPPPGAE